MISSIYYNYIIVLQCWQFFPQKGEISFNKVSLYFQFLFSFCAKQASAFLRMYYVFMIAKNLYFAKYFCFYYNDLRASQTQHSPCLLKLII